MEFTLTPEEKKAIAALKRLEKTWPSSLWLFSASGTLCVMRKGEDGEHVTTSTNSVDAEYHLASIDIENDGGDW